MRARENYEDLEDLLPAVDALIGLLGERGYGDRDRLFRKLVEELGEYAEAIEYNNGSTRKVAKFKGKATPQEKLLEEVVDIVMMGLALARVDGFRTEDVLSAIDDKLTLREKEYKESKKGPACKTCEDKGWFTMKLKYATSNEPCEDCDVYERGQNG